MERDAKTNNQVIDQGTEENKKDTREYKYESQKSSLVESLSDVSISTISNSSGIESDVYNNVVKQLNKKKKEERKKRGIRNDKKKKKKKCVEEEKSNKKSKRKKVCDFDSEIKKRRIRKRKKNYSRSVSQSKDSFRKSHHNREISMKEVKTIHGKKKEEFIPKDPFNPLLLAYVKDRKINEDRKFKKERKSVNDKWEHDKYEADSTDEHDDEKENNQKKKLVPKIDIIDVRKNIWKSKAGGVCILENSDDDEI